MREGGDKEGMARGGGDEEYEDRKGEMRR